MRLIRTEVWERLIFNDEEVSNPFDEEGEEGTIFRSPHGMFVTMNIDLNVKNEKEVKRAYNEKNTDAFEILKQGIPPEEHIWIGKCNVCLSEVKAKYSALHNIDWSAEGEGCATCPFCQQSSIKFTRRIVELNNAIRAQACRRRYA